MSESHYIGFKTEEGIPSKPLPKQKHLLEFFSRKDQTLADGSFGWGKTDALVYAAIFDSIKYPGNLSLLGRKYIDSFNKTTLDSLLTMLPMEIIKRHNKQEHEIELFNGSKIVYMQLDSSREAIQKINSMNLGFFGVDQLEDIDEEVWVAGNARLRRKRSRRHSLATCNPAGHDWVWNRFIRQPGKNGTGHVSGKIWREGVPPPTCQEDVTFDVCDNPHLTWDYIRRLLTEMPDRWVKRFVFGSWENFEGLVWPDARQEPFNERHPEEGGHVVKPFKIPKHWDKYVILDHGHRNPTAILLVAVDFDGNWWLYDCHSEAGRWVDYHASILESKTHNDDITAFLADPDIFRERESEYTIARQYEDFGFYFEPANNDLGGGIDNVARAWQERRIRVFDLPQFDTFWDEVLNYRWAEIRIQGIRNDPERPIKSADHYCDDLRYMANRLEASAKPKKPVKERYWINRNRGFRAKAFMGV